MAISDLPANQAKLNFYVLGQQYSVIAMTGEESISHGFNFSIEVLLDNGLTLEALLKNKAQLSFSGHDGIHRNVYGVIVRAESKGKYNAELNRAVITLVSHFNLLKNSRDTRIILGLTVVEIIKQTCVRNGIGWYQLQFNLAQSYQAQAYVLQANETDWDFLQRIMSHAGIYCYSSVNEEPDKSSFETVIFTDNNSYCPYIIRDVLHYIPHSNQPETLKGKASVGIYFISISYKQTAQRFSIHDENQDTPEVKIIATVDSSSKTNNKDTEKPTEQIRFGLGANSVEHAEQLAGFCAEHAQCESFSINTQGNVVDMAAGYICSLDTSNFEAEYSADYIITKVAHRASQGVSFNLDEASIDYRSEAQCIPRSTPYRSPILTHPIMPINFTARVESNGKYAQLDEQGRYCIRPHSDLTNRGHAQASIPIRKMQAYGGNGSSSSNTNNQNYGWHMPLNDDAEVLLSCLNGDPNRPIIVGSLPNPDNPSPVTSVNRTQNIIRTQSGNELCLDDMLGKEAISLKTFNGDNILHLDANALGQKIKLATKHGALSLFAKQVIKIKSGDDIKERIGNNRTQTIGDVSITKTLKKEIHHQSKTDYLLTAKLNIKTQSAENTEFKAGRNCNVTVDKNARLTIKGRKGFFATIQNNNVVLQAASNINIKGNGGGDITFEQSGGGFKIDSVGIAHLYGNKISVSSNRGVNLNGNVSYNISPPNIPSEMSTEAPMLFNGADKIIDNTGRQVMNLAWSESKIRAGEIVELQFMVKSFEGGENVTIKIYEIEVKGEKRKIETLKTKIDDGTGHHSLQWQRSLEDAENDYKEEPLESNENIEKNPLEYIFEVDVDGTKSIEPSNTLWLTRDFEVFVEAADIILKDGSKIKNSQPTPDGTIVKISAANRQSHYSETISQIAIFRDVIIGPIRGIEIDNESNSVEE